MKTKIMLALALVMGLTISASAQVTSGLNNHHQRARISQGVRSGELTRFERHKLRKEEKRYHRHLRHAKRNDGHIGPRERKMLKHEQRKIDRHIYRYKHNRFDRK